MNKAMRNLSCDKLKVEPLEDFLKGLKATNSYIQQEPKSWIVFEIVSDNARAHADDISFSSSVVGLRNDVFDHGVHRSKAYNLRGGTAAAVAADQRRHRRQRSYAALSHRSSLPSNSKMSRWNDSFDSDERTLRVCMSLPSFPTRKPYPDA